jgi:hypothetical protein
MQTEVTQPHWILLKDGYGTGYANNAEGRERLLKDIQQAQMWLAYLKDTAREMGLLERDD